jgi:hypothetical protein
VDLNAWSSLSVAPMILFVFVVSDYWTKRSNLAIGLLLTAVVVTMTLLYPEAIIFMAPFIILFNLIKLHGLQSSRVQTLFRSCALVLVSIVVLSLSYYAPLRFGIQQLRFGNSSASEPWGSYFQAFFVGQNGTLDGPSEQFLYSIPFAILGMYFLTPQFLELASLGNALQSFWGITVSLGLVSMLLITMKRKYKEAIYIALFPTLFVVPLIAKFATIWVAGKALNYLIPVYFALIVIVITELNLGSKNRRNLVLTTSTTVWVATQVVFAAHRIESVRDFGIPHKPPYISIQDNSLKMNQDWTISKAQFENCTAVKLDVQESFQRFYLQMKLNEFELTWYDISPVNSYFGVGSDIGTMKKLTTGNVCVLTNKNGAIRFFDVSL